MHVDMLKAEEDSTRVPTVRTTLSFSVAGSRSGSATLTKCDYDFSSNVGVETYLNNNKVHHITKGRMETNFINRRLDGQRHT